MNSKYERLKKNINVFIPSSQKKSPLWQNQYPDILAEVFLQTTI